MLNNGVPEPSANTIKKRDNEWLNAGVKEVPVSVYKQQDDDWLNAENDQPLEAVDESPLNRATIDRPEIKIKQDGTILNITVIASKKQDLKSEQTVINLKINLPPQVVAKKGEGPYDIDITADESSLSDESLEDIITTKPVDEALIQSYALMDEITVRPAENPIIAIPPLMDGISIRSVENQVTESHVLMDEVTVKPVENPVIAIPPLMDEISIRSVENQVTESHVLMDEVSVKPSPGPINMEYDLVDDLITKRWIYRTGKAKPSNDTVLASSVETITNPVESPIEKAEPVETVSVNEITNFLSEERDFKPAAIPPEVAEIPSTPFTTSVDEGTGNVSSRAEIVYKRAELRGAVIKALAALRIYNNKRFYIQDASLTQAEPSMQEPQFNDFAFKVLDTVTDLDELIKGGYDLVMNISKIKRGLKKGMVAFLIFIERELASMGWACMTEESKATFRGYPYHDDFDRQACIVGDWTNPKFQDCGISNYLKNQRQQLLKEKGFTFERSIVEESEVKDLRSMRDQKIIEITYKRRTYTNVSVPGILGVELWKEHQLNESDADASHKMITLLVLALPSPPMVAAQRKYLI
jgi:hypothetical protein